MSKNQRLTPAKCQNDVRKGQVALHSSTQWFVAELVMGFLHYLYKRAVLELGTKLLGYTFL